MKDDRNEHLLKDLALQYISASGKQQLFAERTVMERWPDYVGAFFAPKTKYLSITNGILKVKVTNAALRFELNAQKSLIIEKINADYTFPVVKDIVFL